jgi:hypothetical protein
MSENDLRHEHGACHAQCYTANDLALNMAKPNTATDNLSYSFFEICNRSFDQYLLSAEIKENECYLDIVTKTEGGIYDVTGITSHTAILRATYRTARLNSHN